jgi:hypothetical protein
METLRPAVKDDDGYVQKIIKYIPAEIVAGYTALVGYLTVTANSEIPAHYTTYYLIILVVLVLITPFWTYFAVLDNSNITDHNAARKRAFSHALIATIAFAIWVYAIGNPLLKALLCNCMRTDCPDCAYYSSVLGSIILVLFTIITPLIERIVLGPKVDKKN